LSLRSDFLMGLGLSTHGDGLRVLFLLHSPGPLMATYGKKASEKVEQVMHERKTGTLKSGSGEKVTDPKQAIAIALSEARKEGDKVPFPPKKTAAKKAVAKKAPAKKAPARKTTARKNATPAAKKRAS
jgi:hypothetical protein